MHALPYTAHNDDTTHTAMLTKHTEEHTESMHIQDNFSHQHDRDARERTRNNTHYTEGWPCHRDIFERRAARSIHSKDDPTQSCLP
mmetsp:Transcript_9874/g.28694  ORF Transcript_9874/g.28694 Transcript_9874/m.28694 type:complete len:86 (+) Transcript_9874:171-428(+)